jgi:cytochrome b pre-mRNA-processing protein 3
LQSLGQGIFDRICEDMDHNLREIGVGDLKVPKQMQRMGEAFYGRAQAYRAAWAAKDDSLLAEILRRNIYCGWPPTLAAAPRLAAYVGEALRDLGAQPSISLADGELHLPEPSKIAPVTS